MKTSSYKNTNKKKKKTFSLNSKFSFFSFCIIISGLLGVAFFLDRKNITKFKPLVTLMSSSTFIETLDPVKVSYIEEKIILDNIQTVFYNFEKKNSFLNFNTNSFSMQTGQQLNQSIQEYNNIFLKKITEVLKELKTKISSVRLKAIKEELKKNILIDWNETLLKYQSRKNNFLLKKIQFEKEKYYLTFLINFQDLKLGNNHLGKEEKITIQDMLFSINRHLSKKNNQVTWAHSSFKEEIIIALPNNENTFFLVTKSKFSSNIQDQLIRMSNDPNHASNVRDLTINNTPNLIIFSEAHQFLKKKVLKLKKILSHSNSYIMSLQKFFQTIVKNFDNLYASQCDLTSQIYTGPYYIEKFSPNRLNLLQNTAEDNLRINNSFIKQIILKTIDLPSADTYNFFLKDRGISICFLNSISNSSSKKILNTLKNKNIKLLEMTKENNAITSLYLNPNNVPKAVREMLSLILFNQEYLSETIFNTQKYDVDDSTFLPNKIEGSFFESSSKNKENFKEFIQKNFLNKQRKKEITQNFDAFLKKKGKKTIEIKTLLKNTSTEIEFLKFLIEEKTNNKIKLNLKIVENWKEKLLNNPELEAAFISWGRDSNPRYLNDMAHTLFNYKNFFQNLQKEEINKIKIQQNNFENDIFYLLNNFIRSINFTLNENTLSFKYKNNKNLLFQFLVALSNYNEQEENENLNPLEQFLLSSNLIIPVFQLKTFIFFKGNKIEYFLTKKQRLEKKNFNTIKISSYNLLKNFYYKDELSKINTIEIFDKRSEQD